MERWILDKSRFPSLPDRLRMISGFRSVSFSRPGYWLVCMGLGLLLAIPAQTLAESELDSLVDEGTHMKELMMRMRIQLSQPALIKGGASELPDRDGGEDPGFGLTDASSWVWGSAILDDSLRERWFWMIEQGVLGRFSGASSGVDQDAWESAAVGFVHGEEIPWYGSLQFRGYGDHSGMADSSEVRARLMVAPRLEDGSFLHLGLSFQSFSYWGGDASLHALAGETVELQGSGRHLAFDIGYSRESYAIQAQYLKSTVRAEGLPFRNRAKTFSDGFHIRGAWRIMGEQMQSRYAPGLLAHIKPRDEEGIWELVVRYANLNSAPDNLERNAGSMLLGIHWRTDSTLALELDYVEGGGENFQSLTDGGLTLRGTLSF